MKQATALLSPGPCCPNPAADNFHLYPQMRVLDSLDRSQSSVLSKYNLDIKQSCQSLIHPLRTVQPRATAIGLRLNSHNLRSQKEANSHDNDLVSRATPSSPNTTSYRALSRSPRGSQPCFDLNSFSFRPSTVPYQMSQMRSRDRQLLL